MSWRLRRRLIAAARLALLVLVLAVVAFPVYWMVASSVSGASQFAWPPHLLPTQPSLVPYVRVVTNHPIGQWFLNTAIVSLGATALTLLVSVSAALSLSRYRTPFNRGAGLVVLVTQMLPATLLVIPMYVIFSHVGLIDTLGGLVIADTAFSIPLAIWMLKGFFDGIPREIEEAAMVDGCSEMGAFRRVTIPLALPGIVAVSIFAFMVAWGEFFFARTLINSQSNWVLSVGLSSFQGEYTLQWSDMLAAATLFAIPPLVFFVGLQRHLISGLTGGAVKG
jgi:multiple sugar transport system permease protein